MGSNVLQHVWTETMDFVEHFSLGTSGTMLYKKNIYI